jgi:hypothetical protein
LSQHSQAVAERIDGLDWPQFERELDAHGWAMIPGLLPSGECAGVIDLYDRAEPFRKEVDMQRHGFGAGQYKYFAYPLPDLIQDLRQNLYPRLAPTANRWAGLLGRPAAFPANLETWLEHCHRAGQSKPTPLVLRYGPGDYNRLHQDLYGEHVFPIQVAILLSQPERDFTGGEFVLAEQRPRMQSKVEVIPLTQGDAVAFAVHHRPARGTRGAYRVNLRHGVSRLRSGSRTTLGIIFHDAA